MAALSTWAVTEHADWVTYSNGNLLLTVLVAGKAKIMGSFGVWWGLLPGSLCALRVEVMADLSAVPFIKTRILLIRVLPSSPVLFPKTPLLKLSH